MLQQCHVHLGRDDPDVVETVSPRRGVPRRQNIHRRRLRRQRLPQDRRPVRSGREQMDETRRDERQAKSRRPRRELRETVCDRGVRWSDEFEFGGSVRSRDNGLDVGAVDVRSRGRRGRGRGAPRTRHMRNCDGLVCGIYMNGESYEPVIRLESSIYSGIHEPIILLERSAFCLSWNKS